MSTVRDEPWRRDPIADYDLLGRKTPKKLGLLELARGVPAIRELFSREVPADRFDVDGDVALVACQCGQQVYCEHNQAVYCGGPSCGRWFWFLGARVLVARFDPPRVET